MSAAEEREKTAEAVAREGALPMPVGPGRLAEGTPDVLTQTFAPVAALREDPRACEACGDLPESWCPDCAACKAGCFGGFDGDACEHANAPWGGGR